jgi:two-component system, sensor histidine kinase and response regulator
MTRASFRLLIGLSSIALVVAGISDLAGLPKMPAALAGMTAMLLGMALLLLRADRRQAADAEAHRHLTERERLYHELFDGSLQGIIIVEEKGRVLLANPAAARMFGYAGPEDLLALETIDVLLDAEDRARVVQYRRERKAGGTPPLRYEVRGHRLDGTAMWCEVHMHRTRWEGRPVAQAFLVDATERKRGEVALELARDAAEAASRAKSEFLANISHEIRTPMNAVIGLSHLALAGSRDPAQRDHLTKIGGAAKALLGVIDDILDFSQIEAGGLAIERIEFELNEVLESLRTMLGAAAEQRGLALVFEPGTDLPRRLVGDPLRLGRILRNLIANSIKFSDHGTVTVTVEAARAAASGAVLRFSVRDRGIGMSVEHQNRLFQAFSQADGSSIRRYGGTGLGLIICQRLVESMGGRIVVDSVLGHGSTFSFTLDFDLPATGDQGAAAGSAGSRLAGLRVLVVEDNLVNQTVAEGILACEGAIVTIADNGRVAVDLLRGAVFDAVLMDLQMPEMDGYAATRAIRRELGLTRLPIIAVTAHALIEERQRCLEVGMNEHISKPVDPQRLVETVHSLAGAAAQPTLLPGIDMVDALNRLGGNRALLDKVYADFCRQYADAASEIGRLIADGSRNDAAALGHAIKGVAGNIGAKRVFGAAKALEAELLAGGDGVTVLPALREALAELSDFTPADRPAAIGTAVDVDPAMLGRTIIRLRGLLKARDLDAEECFDSLKGLCAGGPLREPLLRLEASVDALDFEAALEPLAELERMALGTAPA